MCGIVGFIDFNKKLGPSDLKRMVQIIAHRGPDDSGLFFSELREANIGFGHRRLSILELSSLGHQPMQFENLTITYNGEIYNFMEIRISLQQLGYTFNSHSDTEVILKAFHCWGVSAIDHFVGMFAIAIFDAGRNKLFLMDTCDSGEVEEDSQVEYYAMAKKKGIMPRTTRAIGIELIDNRLNKRRAYLYDTNRFIYNDLLRRSGAIVFSSSKGGEFSYESDDLKNGFFTEEIINALNTNKADTNNDTHVSTDELRDYVSKTVSKHTEDMQHPTVDRDNIYQKFSFPIVGR